MGEGAVDIEKVNERLRQAQIVTVNAYNVADLSADGYVVLFNAVADIPKLIRELQWYRDRDRVAEGGR